jgi:Uncharacterized protein conserved in bacteria (DUF2188)
MKLADIHVVALSRSDWVVKEDSGREFGHYATKSEAQAVGIKLASKRRTGLIVHDEDGKRVRSQANRSWIARLFGR